MVKNNLIICKIAYELDNTPKNPSKDNELEQFKTIQWDDKEWRTLFPLDIDLRDLLKIVKTRPWFVKTFATEIFNDFELRKRFLAVTYAADQETSDRVKLSHFEQELLPLLFQNYPQLGEQNQANNADENDCKGNLMQEYVTTALYDALYQKHKDCDDASMTTNELAPLPPLPECFRPTLCNYQVRTVKWLLQREQHVSSFPNYYIRLQARDGETHVYKHELSWHIQGEEPKPIVLPPGGILADEMGLGKTVEMLALIVLNKRPANITTLPTSLLNVDEPSKKRTRLASDLFCICRSKTKTNLIKCNGCLLRQHIQCVKRFEEKQKNAAEDDDVIADTVEQYEVEEDYLCPSCWYKVTQDASLPATTTFIVTPNTIKTQWITEIQRHLKPTLKVFDYNEKAASSWISPRQLATYDIVITDYNLLRREIYHTSAYVSERVTRHEKPSMRRMSPLLMIEWWRVCLDEAQMVESKGTHVGTMVRQLPAINRWAVTGTPIQRSIDDLRGLLEFIGFDEPLTPLSGWKALIDDFLMQQNATDTCDNKLTLVDVLQRCMWRTCKSKVYNELPIPPQIEQVHRIRLSNLENLFYSEQHALCETSFHAVLRKHIENADGILKISPKIMNIILYPLLKIRQCCSIPVVNAGQRAQNRNTANVPQKLFLQPKDLHAHLKSTNELECKSELRTMASSYNGMAAIYFIRGNYEDAVKNYEMVLRLARDYKDINITVDSLLQIHALHNIQQAFYTSPTNKQTSLPPTEVIAKYEEECNALEWKYLEPYASTMHTIQTGCTSAQEMLTKLESAVEAPLLEFIDDLTDEIGNQKEQFAIALLNRFHDEFATVFDGSPKMEELQSISGMLYVIVIWYQKVEKAQKYLNEEFEKLKFYTMNVNAKAKTTPAIWREMTQFISTVFDCHLSEILDDKKGQEQEKSKKKSKKSKHNLCKLCQIRNALNGYECLLFNKVVDETTNMTEGLENPAFEVALIKVLFNFLRTKSAFLHFTQQLDKHWEAIECRQQLCKKLIKYWIEIEYTVKAYDELDMCKMRISLAANEEERTHFKLLDYELDNSFVEQQTNLHNAQRQFAMKLARLKYITHLEENAATNQCPICHSDEENRYAVLECGHNICIECLRTIRKHKSHQKLSCPICRNEQSSEKIYYVTRNATTPAENPIEVIGDFSSKITYIVRLILKLQRDHATDVQPLKILIFSQWSEILNPIATALAQNSIRHRLNLTPRTIEEFKSSQLGITCLLMPLRKGCNGLNLIEATHVFLVEPILNPGEEAQAIGRVHRFGQTKSTTVHRFIVCNTIEENIFNVVNAGKQSHSNWEFKQMSVESLEGLFRLENDVSEDYIPIVNEPMDVT